MNKTNFEIKNMMNDFLEFAGSKGRKAIKVGPSSVAIGVHDDDDECLIVHFSDPGCSMQWMEHSAQMRIRRLIERYSQWQSAATRRAREAEKRASELTALIQELNREIEG